MISPSLFHKFIDKLIFDCTNLNIGARICNLNVSITVYADDIILLSPVDSHLQKLLDTCESYSKFWRIKFNANKSNIMEFGQQFFKNSTLYLNDVAIPKGRKYHLLGSKNRRKIELQRNCYWKIQQSSEINFFSFLSWSCS